MRLRIAFTIDLTRSKRPEAGEDAPMIFESQGSMVETSPQPKYVGFEAVDPFGVVWEDRK